MIACPACGALVSVDMLDEHIETSEDCMLAVESGAVTLDD